MQRFHDGLGAQLCMLRIAAPSGDGGPSRFTSSGYAVTSPVHPLSAISDAIGIITHLAGTGSNMTKVTLSVLTAHVFAHCKIKNSHSNWRG